MAEAELLPPSLLGRPARADGTAPEVLNFPLRADGTDPEVLNLPPRILHAGGMLEARTEERHGRAPRLFGSHSDAFFSYNRCNVTDIPLTNIHQCELAHRHVADAPWRIMH